MLQSPNAMFQDTAGGQSNAKKTQLGFVLTKMMLLVPLQPINTYFWQPTQDSRAKMIGKSMKKQDA